MDKQLRFSINAPRVAHQTLDGETIVIDFDNGAYYSLEETGSIIWELCAHTASVGVIQTRLAQLYGGAPAQIEGAVEVFLAELERDALITPLAAGVPAPEPPLLPSPAEKRAFVLPVVRKYTDMQDLLLLDPIHDVDESGWPLQKEEPAAS